MRRIRFLLWIAAGALPLLGSGDAWALPRFSARYEQNCGLCHVNPTGGGQRTLYATQFIMPTEMSLTSYTPEQLAAVDPQLSKNVTIGLDMRTMHHHADRHSIPYGNFLQMEGAVDLTFQPDPHVVGYVSKGLTAGSQAYGLEAYGLLYVLPFNGYAKVGWFVPPFGWRFDDHTAFVRQKALSASNSAADLDGPPAPNNDVGVEFGIFPQRLALTAAVLNGDPGANLDNNNAPAYAAQGIYRVNLAGLGIGLGGSFWSNAEPGGRRQAAGPYGYLKWSGVTWLAESDWSRLRTADAQGNQVGSTTMWAVSQELSIPLHRGIELRGTYDSFDPDIHAKTGARFRYGAGFDVIPWPFVDILATLNVHHFKLGHAVAGQDYTQSEIQLHFFY